MLFVFIIIIITFFSFLVRKINESKSKNDGNSSVIKSINTETTMDIPRYGTKRKKEWKKPCPTRIHANAHKQWLSYANKAILKR